MAKNSIAAYGAKGKTNLLRFDPEDLHIVTDPKHPLYDPRADPKNELPLNDALVASIRTYGVKSPVIVWKDAESGRTGNTDDRPAALRVAG